MLGFVPGIGDLAERKPSQVSATEDIIAATADAEGESGVVLATREFGRPVCQDKSRLSGRNSPDDFLAQRFG